MLKNIINYLLDRKITNFSILDIGSYALKYAKVKIKNSNFYIEEKRKVSTKSISKGLILDGKLFEEELRSLLDISEREYIYIIFPNSNFLIKGEEEVDIPYDLGFSSLIEKNIFKDIYFKYKEDKEYFLPELYTSHLCPHTFILDSQEVKNILNLTGRFIEVKAFPFFLKKSYTIETLKNLLKNKKILNYTSQAVMLAASFLKEKQDFENNNLIISFSSSGTEGIFLKQGFLAWSYFDPKFSIKAILKKLSKFFDLPYIEVENYFVKEGIKVLRRQSYTLRINRRSFRTYKIINAILILMRNIIKNFIYLVSKKGYKISKIYITGYPLKFRDFKEILYDKTFLGLSLKLNPWEMKVDDFDFKTIYAFIDYLNLVLKNNYPLDINLEPYEILNMEEESESAPQKVGHV